MAIAHVLLHPCSVVFVHFGATRYNKKVYFLNNFLIEKTKMHIRQTPSNHRELGVVARMSATCRDTHFSLFFGLVFANFFS